MSAFQVSPNHIGALIRWYLLDNPSHLCTRWREFQTPCCNDAADMMAALSFECWRSVRYRYPDGPLPGPIAFEDSPVLCDDNLHLYKPLTPAQVLKACACLEYQSCEHPGWETSEAFRLLDSIKSAAIARLPGYEEAEWEIRDGAPQQARTKTHARGGK